MLAAPSQVPLSKGGQSGGERPLPWVARRPRSAAREGAPSSVLNKEPFAGPEAPARGGRCAQKASALFSPYLLFTRSPAGPGRGGGDPRSAPGLASEPRGHRARRELLPAAPTWRGSQSLTWPRSVASASRPRPRPPVGWKGPGVGRALAPGARQEGRCGRRDSGARTRTQTSVGAERPGAHREVGAPAGARGSAAGRPAAPETKMAVRGAPRRPALAVRHPARPARGAARWSPAARPGPSAGPRMPNGDSGRGTPAGLVGWPLAAGAPGRRAQARGAPHPGPAATPEPQPQPRPRRSYLVWARAAVRAGGGERGWSAEEATRPLLSLWLPLGRRRLYLTAAVPARTRHMG